MINVYLTEDDREDQEIFELALKVVKPESVVTVFNNGMELMTALNNGGRPDVIFLDINMPVLNGFDSLQAIRSNDGFTDIPVIVFTTSNKSEDADLMRRLGADYFITKPLEYGLLLSVLKKAVDKKIDGRFQKSTHENFIIY